MGTQESRIARLQRRAFGTLMTVAALALLSGCGDDKSSNGGTTMDGRFVDSPVAGLAFVSGDQSGLTGSDGGFTYQDGQTITFSVGDIVVGQGTPKALMTPVSLVSGASDESDPTVTNIARFLQTLDDDADPQNGITITQAVTEQAAGSSVNFGQSIEDFGDDAAVQEVVETLTSATNAGERPLVSASMAQNHLMTTLLARFVGNYSGQYSGDDAGTWEVEVDSAGAIEGSGASSMEPEEFDIAGSVSSSGTAHFVAGEVTTGAVFSGTVTESGGISGIWINAYWEMNGTFSGQKQ